MKTLPVVAAFGAAIVTLSTAALPGLARDQDGQDPSPLEIMADAVLIDSHCGTIPVNMGALLLFGERHGIAPVDIMPLGALRRPFEAALARRFDGISHDTLCTSVVAREQDLAPGVISAP